MNANPKDELVRRYEDYLTRRGQEVNDLVLLAQAVHRNRVTNEAAAATLRGPMYRLFVTGDPSSPRFDDAFDSVLRLALLALGTGRYVPRGVQPGGLATTRAEGLSRGEAAGGGSSQVEFGSKGTGCLGRLFDETFPHLLPVLLGDPRRFAIMFFNVFEKTSLPVDHLHGFLADVAGVLSPSPWQVRGVVALGLWSGGDPRFRRAALKFLEDLEPEAGFVLARRAFNLHDAWRGNGKLERDIAGTMEKFLSALRSNGWIHPSMAAEFSGGPVPLLVSYGGFAGFPGGVFDALPRVAAVVQDHLFVHTETGNAWWCQLDALGAWHWAGELPPCKKVVYASQTDVYGVTADNQLLRVNDGKRVKLRGVSQVLDAHAASGRLVLVIVKRSTVELQEFDAVLESNPSYAPTKTIKGRRPVPTTTHHLRKRPFGLCLTPTGELLLGEQIVRGRKKDEEYVLVKGKLDDDWKGEPGDVVFSTEKGPFAFGSCQKGGFVWEYDGTVRRFDPSFERELGERVATGFGRPTSLVAGELGVFATSADSFRVLGLVDGMVSLGRSGPDRGAGDHLKFYRPRSEGEGA
ncbi:MAG: hypothetical protein Kow0069_33220 [Promethearchaeota archaeon]